MVSCSANCKHQSVNEMMLPCRRMWQGTSIWRQHTTRITCSALRMDGQRDLVHVQLFATVDKTEASEAYAKLLSFICTWWDMEKDFARVLLPTRAGDMCVWVAACRTKIDNWRGRDYKRRHTRFYQRKKIWDAHDLNPITRFVPKFHVWKGTRRRRLDPDTNHVRFWEGIKGFRTRSVWYACYVSGNRIEVLITTAVSIVALFYFRYQRLPR